MAEKNETSEKNEKSEKAVANEANEANKPSEAADEPSEAADKPSEASEANEAADPPSTLRDKLDTALRVTVALVGTLPMTVLLLSLIARGLFAGSQLAEALMPVLLLPCWLAASSVCLVAERGTRLTAWVAGITAAAALLLRVVG